MIFTLFFKRIVETFDETRIKDTEFLPALYLYNGIKRRDKQFLNFSKHYSSISKILRIRLQLLRLLRKNCPKGQKKVLRTHSSKNHRMRLTTD